jgi:hypothetical protein
VRLAPDHGQGQGRAAAEWPAINKLIGAAGKEWQEAELAAAFKQIIRTTSIAPWRLMTGASSSHRLGSIMRDDHTGYAPFPVPDHQSLAQDTKTTRKSA